MIVADTNIISYLFLPTDYSEKASRFYQKDAAWAAPSLWRSEFRNVLALYLRQQIITLTQAVAIQEEAEALMADHEFNVTSVQVLTLADSSHCSAYDCEFVALAKQLSVKLVTQDKKILREFPEVAVSLDDFLN
ncbi:MAG: type II toxin-antitoxin system VapC family toxin [Methylobacter sp.]|nr:type II toxin-antitoxin system VapC family toxin [Methylobacter sp.]